MVRKTDTQSKKDSMKTAAKKSADKKNNPQLTQMSDTAKKQSRIAEGARFNASSMAGTNIVDGFINEEYNASLQGKQGLETYDQMRKSDAQVFATLLAMELPIRATKWFVDPAKDENGEISNDSREIARFVEKNLFEQMSNTWNELLQEILTMLSMGHSVFEKVYGLNKDGQIIVKKLGFRKQMTIMKWEMSDGSSGIEQQLPTPVISGPNKGKTTVDIPAEKLLIFSFRKEGDNYEGVSVLRSSYKNWYIKDSLYKYDAIKHERQAIGIPVAYVPNNAGDEEMAEATRIVGNIRGNESTGVVMPGAKTEGYEIEFMDTRGKGGTDLYESIKHHNREIAKNILAQFLELGDTQSGSRALSEDQSDLFLLNLSAIAQQIADVMNRFLITELVDLNFDVEDYPKLKFKKLGDTDYDKFANTLATLSGAELLKPDENIEDFIREELGLPGRTIDEEVDEDGEIQDEGDGGTPDDTPDGNDDGLDSLSKELETLAASEEDDVEAFCEFDDLVDELSEAMFAHVENSEEFVAKGDHLSKEHKDKIAEALRKKGGKELLAKKSQVTAKVKKTTDSIDRTTDEFKREAAGIRSSIDSLKAEKDRIPKGRMGTAQRKALATKVKALIQQIKNLRAGKNAEVKPLKELRSKDIQTRKQVNQIIKERKAEIQKQVKQIRSDLKEGRITLNEAINPMKEDVKANIVKMQELREDMKDLPKGDERRLALKAMIDGLLQENTTNRDTQSSLRSEYSAESDQGKKNIDQIKKDSELYHESHDHKPVGEIDDDYLSISARFNNQFITALQNEAADDVSYMKLKEAGLKANEYAKDSPRPLTFAENKVNFVSLKKAMDKFELTLEESVDVITAKMKDDLLLQIKQAVEANDIAKIGQIKAKHTGELSQALTDVQKEMFEVGKKSAAAEMSVQVPSTKAEVKGAMRVQNDAVIEGLVSQMENQGKLAVTSLISKKGGSITTTSATEAIAAASANIDKAVEKAKAALNTLGITGAVNLGRSSIFERYPEKVYGFQYSAILDGRTTEMCRSLDGRVVAAGSSEFYDYTPPRHYNCRSIWVEILMTETFKPKITGIPSSITANLTIDTFKDLKSPIILQNSPAIKVIQEEIDDTKKKLEALQGTGKYEARQEGYRNKIDILEKSIKDAEKVEFKEYVKAILRQDGIIFKE